jgi:hypothetical protein
MHTIGIDPGKKGAIVILNNNLSIESYLLFQDKWDYSTIARNLFQFIKDFSCGPVYFEDVHSIFGASAKSNFSFGKTTGVQLGVVSAIFPDVHLVQPKTWQGKVITSDDKGSTTKERALSAAQRIFPDYNFIPKGCRTPSDGLLDAALIAYYGQLKQLE